MFKEHGQAIRTADGTVILRTSGIVSRDSNNHSSIQTQIQLKDKISWIAPVFEVADKLQISFTKWIFLFQPHPDGGYEYVPRGSVPILLDTDSSELIKSMVRQYRLRKSGK